MAIRLRNAVTIYLPNDNTAAKGSSSATFVTRARANWPPNGTTAGAVLISSNSGYVTFGSYALGGQGLILNAGWNVDSGGGPSATTNVFGGVVNHLAITFDKDDPSKQALYVNGDKTLMTSPSTSVLPTGPLTNVLTGQNIDPVANSPDYSLEDMIVIYGYAATAAEILYLRNGGDPSTIGPGATQRNYWPLTGTTGATVGPYDPGVANAWWTDPTNNHIGIVLGTQSGSLLTYDAPMPYVPLITQQCRVLSSGKSVRYTFTQTISGEAVAMTADSLAANPTIKINGGSPITLERPYYTASLIGVQFFLPAGMQIVPSDVVTTTTVADWISTSGGNVDAVTDSLMTNSAGGPLYINDPPVHRYGWNISYGSDYGTAIHIDKNMAVRGGVDYSVPKRADGTVMVELKAYIDATGANGNIGDPGDYTGAGYQFGHIALQYDDNDPSQPTLIEIVGPSAYENTDFTELVGYRNPGDPTTGVGKGGVWAVSPPSWTVTLASSCSSTDTVLTLTSNANLFDVASYGQGPLQYVVFGGEYMLITNTNTSLAQITVTRGWSGTAVSHLANDTGTMKKIKVGANPALKFSNATTGAPNYKNLFVLGPGDFTLPATVGPIELDRSPASFYDTSQYVKDTMVPGIGVIRQMDSTEGGFGNACEVEHLREDTDQWQGEGARYIIEPKILSSKPATAANAPYFYNPVFVKNAVKYPVVLAADITTAPAAGTIEVLQFTNDPANPLMFTSRVELTSGEVIRVMSVSGSNVTAMRGQEGTTPATCAAGTMQARWRVPLTDAALKPVNNGWSVIQTDGPHGLWSRTFPAYPSSCDLNTLARFTVTLTADVPATYEYDTGGNVMNSTIHITVDDPANIEFLQEGMFLVFDSESMRVGGPYDSTAGTILVNRSDGASAPGRDWFAVHPPIAAHVTGTRGYGSSGGVLFQLDGGSRRIWSFNAIFGASMFVTGPDTFVAKHKYLPDKEGDTWVQVGDQTFTPIVDDKTACFHINGPPGVHSYARAANIVKLAPGCDMWLNIPEYASNDAIDHIARTVRDILPAGQHRILVELGNELWNISAPRLDTATMIGNVCGYPSAAYPTGLPMLMHCAALAKQRVKAIFDETGRGSEVKLVVAWQQGGIPTVIDAITAAGFDSEMDILSTAPYYIPGGDGSTIEPNLAAAYELSDDEQCIDVWAFNLEHNRSSIAGALYSDGAAQRSYEASSGRSLEYICYEGGPDSYVPTPSASITDSYTRQIDLHYNPNNWNASYDWPYILNRISGCNGIALFNYGQAPFGPFAGKPYSYWGANFYNGQPYGKGDGSDGKADNRLCLARPGQTHTKAPYVNQDMQNVSVRTGAMIAYAAARAAYNPASVNASGAVACDPIVFAGQGSASGPSSNNAAGFIDQDSVVFVGTASASGPASNDASGSVACESVVFAGAGSPPAPDPVPFIGRKAMPRWMRF